MNDSLLEKLIELSRDSEAWAVGEYLVMQSIQSQQAAAQVAFWISILAAGSLIITIFALVIASFTEGPDPIWIAPIMFEIAVGCIFWNACNRGARTVAQMYESFDYLVMVEVLKLLESVP